MLPILTMRRNIVRFVLVLMTMITMPLPGRAQGAFPRDGNEALALRLAKGYQDSLTRTAGWERAQKDYQDLVRDAALGGPFGVMAVSEEDRMLGIRAGEEITLERASRQRLLEFWGRDRAAPPGPARSFAWRYGPLATVTEPSVDSKYNKVEYAIRNFPFTPNTTPATPPATTPTRGSSPFDGLWHTHRVHTDGCSYIADEDFVFSTDANGTTTIAAESFPARGQVTGHTYTFSYGSRRTGAFTLGDDGKSFSGSFSDLENKHRGTFQGRR